MKTAKIKPQFPTTSGVDFERAPIFGFGGVRIYRVTRDQLFLIVKEFKLFRLSEVKAAVGDDDLCFYRNNNKEHSVFWLPP